MSVRARSARRLASRLTAAAGVHVIVQYQRDRKRYRVVWEDGPAVDAMRDLASRHHDQVTPLEMSSLDWSRAADMTTRTS
jgi:hypothetical protein